jgi:proteasome lid subunit RPN8/RPN11
MLKRSDVLDPQITDRLMTLAKARYPNEMCAAVMCNGEVREFDNTAANPTVIARFPKGQLIDMLDAKEVLALAHSHTNGMPYPSEQDMRFQLSTAVPHILITTNGEACLPVSAWGDQMEPAPLEDRGFIHAIADCYELMRDYYRLRQIPTPVIPRSWRWWDKGQSLFEDNLASTGFREVTGDTLKEGDGLLFRVGNRVVTANHGAVYLGGGLMLHHATSPRHPYDPTRLSNVEPVGRWIEAGARWFRYEAQGHPARPPA